METEIDYEAKLDRAVEKVNEAIRELNRLSEEQRMFFEKLKGLRKC